MNRLVSSDQKNLSTPLASSFLTTKKVLADNFGEKIFNLEKTLNTWQRRNLTLSGKINIVKTIGISKLICSASALPVPDHYFQERDKLIFNFIWAGKPPKIIKKTP